MFVTAVVVEQLENDGYLRTFKLLPGAGGELAVAFADEYLEPHAGPFHFMDENDERTFEAGFAACKGRKLPEDRFNVVDDEYVFHASWDGIPTEPDSLSYYALSLPEFAVPTEIRFSDPHSDRTYPKNVVRDDGRNRFVTYLGCRSTRGSFDFDLEVKFRNDPLNFRRAKYTDRHMARHGVPNPPYAALLDPSRLRKK